MADDKRVVRTAGVSGTFVLPGLLDTDDGPADLTITPEGVEVTREQWLAVAAAATQNHVIVRLDEDFPVELEPAPKAQEDETPSSPPAGESTESGTTVDGITPPPSTGTTRRGR